MRRMLIGMLIIMALLAAPFAAAEEPGVIVQSSCSIVQSGDYYLVYCFAQVHNESGNVICLEKGSYELHDGEQILSTEEVTQIWPYFVAPGEDGYLFDIVSFEPGEDGPVMPHVTGITYDIEYMTVSAEHASFALQAKTELEMDARNNLTVICRLTNPTDIDAFDPTVAFGLYTQTGGMIYADGMTLKDVGVPAGGSVLVRFYVDEMFVNQWAEFGAAPDHVKVNAAFRADSD